jgi:glycerol-3-phosphate dehydrogenase
LSGKIVSNRPPEFLIINLTCEGVAFLESMGLPKSKLSATRKAVESGKLGFKDEVEYKMYSRHDAPNDELASDLEGSPVMKSESEANK